MTVIFNHTFPVHTVQRMEEHDSFLESFGSGQGRKIVVELRFDLTSEVEEFQFVHAAKIVNFEKMSVER